MSSSISVLEQERPAAEPESPWAVPAIDGPHEDLPAPLEPARVEEPFVVHAPRPAGDPTPVVAYAPEREAGFTWLSAHGGAGSTSLARATSSGQDLTGLWPAPNLGWASAVAIVCRSNAAGVDAAARLIAEAASGMVPGIYVAALVVVADAPVKLSRSMRARIHEISGTVPELVHVPWISTWREDPYTPDKAATAAAAKVAALTKENNK